MSVKRIRQGWINFLVEGEYTHAISLKPNDPRSASDLDSLHRLFVKVHMLVDRAILGSRFARPSRAAQRSVAIGIVEGLPTSGHLHGAFKLDPSNWTKFEGLFQDGPTAAERDGIWRTLVPHGTAVVEPIGDPQGWHRYAFKHVWECDDSDRVVLLPLSVV